MSSIPLYMDHFDGNGRPQNQMGRKTSLDLDHVDDLSILYKSVRKMNELLEVLRVQGARISLGINVKKTKSLMLRLSEDEKVTLGNEKIDQMAASLTLVILLVKTVGA